MPNTSIIKGKTAGTISFGSFDKHIFNVTLNTGTAQIPVPEFGDTWESFTDGLRGLSGSFSAYLNQEESPFVDGTEGIFTIQYDATHSIVFDGKIFGVSVAFDPVGVGQMQASFGKSNQDAPTIVWVS